MKLFLILSIFCLESLVAEPVARVGESLIEPESLHLVWIDPNLSNQDASTVRQQNTRALVNYLENYFTERYLEETGNQITEDEVEQKIDELLVLTYGTAEKPSEEYGKQVKRMAEIVPLLKAYTKDPQKAEKLYTEHYTNSLSRSEWDQLKGGISATGLEQTMKFIDSKLPTDGQIREGYRGQAYAHVLNQKFLDVWGRTSIKFSDWRKERFSEVQILDADYFEIEQLTAWFGYDESSAKIENVKQRVAEAPSVPSVQELVKVVEEVTPSEPDIEETTEVVTAEPTAEAAENPSDWWLWLIGLLVVAVGGFPVLHRKS